MYLQRYGGVFAVPAATAALRQRASFFKAKYHKLKSRRGGGRAALAITHKPLVCICHVLSGNTLYRELGEDYFDKRDKPQAEPANAL